MEWEYICKSAAAVEWQKWLNQWKHQYELETLHMLADKEQITMLIRRRPR
jgi:hypothetical protein